MQHFKSIILLILFVMNLFLLTSCQDECDKCNAAIQHFVSKLPENGCNPEFMQNAVERINNDCDGEVNSAITAAIAADACCNSTIPALACENSGVTPWKTDIKLTNTSDFFLSPVTIFIGTSSDPLQYSIDMNGMSEVIAEDIEVSNFSEMVFSVHRDGVELFISNPVTMYAQRGGSPCVIRKVNFREAGQGIFYSENFNW